MWLTAKQVGTPGVTWPSFNSIRLLKTQKERICVL